MVTWSEPLWVTLDSVGQSPGRSRAGYFLSMLKVNTTSAGVSSVPSENLTPLRMVNVSDVLPGPQAQEGASIGVVLPFCSGVTKTRGAETNPSDRRVSEPLSRLKPPGPKAPFSVEMGSTAFAAGELPP